jgi:hypothetical protein
MSSSKNNQHQHQSTASDEEVEQEECCVLCDYEFTYKDLDRVRCPSCAEWVCGDACLMDHAEYCAGADLEGEEEQNQ